MNFKTGRKKKNYGNIHNGKKSCSCYRNKFYQVICFNPHKFSCLRPTTHCFFFSHQVSLTSSCNVQFFVQNSSTFRLRNQAWPISFWVDILSEQKRKDAGILEIFPFKHFKSLTSLQTGKLFKLSLRQNKKKDVLINLTKSVVQVNGGKQTHRCQKQFLRELVFILIVF